MGVIIKNGIVYASPGSGSNIDDSTVSQISTWSSSKISSKLVSMIISPGEPGVMTNAKVNDFYLDTNTNILYICTEILTTPITDLTDITLKFKDHVYLPWTRNSGSGWARDGAYNISFTSNDLEFNQIYFYQYVGGGDNACKMYYRYLEGSTVVRSVLVCSANTGSSPYAFESDYRVINITDGDDLTHTGSIPQDFIDFLLTPTNGNGDFNVLEFTPPTYGHVWVKIVSLPEVTPADEGKFVRVNSSGVWSAVEQPTEEWIFTTEDQYTTITKEVLLEE